MTRYVSSTSSAPSKSPSRATTLYVTSRAGPSCRIALPPVGRRTSAIPSAAHRSRSIVPSSGRPARSRETPSGGASRRTARSAGRMSGCGSGAAPCPPPCSSRRRGRPRAGGATAAPSTVRSGRSGPRRRVATRARASQRVGSGGVHLRFGCRAAMVSSSRRTGVVVGASCTISGLARPPRRSRASRRRTRRASPSTLGLGRLDHERLGDDQREVDRRRVEAVVDQPLGDVERRDARRLLAAPGREHDLVHAGPVVGQVVVRAEARPQVVGVEDRRSRCRRAGRPGPWCGCRCRRARACRSCPRRSAPARSTLGRFVVELVRRPASRIDDGRGQERREVRSCTPTGPAPGPAAAVRRGEGLVQVDVHHVEAEVAGAGHARAARSGSRRRRRPSRPLVCTMLGDLEDVRLEEAERVRVREHQRRRRRRRACRSRSSRSTLAVARPT